MECLHAVGGLCLFACAGRDDYARVVDHAALPGCGSWGSAVFLRRTICLDEMHTPAPGQWAYHTLMPAKKIAISLSKEAQTLVDRFAADEGLSPSAWFERAVQRAQRRAGVARAVAEARRSGIKGASDAELEKLRKELARGA